MGQESVPRPGLERSPAVLTALRAVPVPVAALLLAAAVVYPLVSILSYTLRDPGSLLAQALDIPNIGTIFRDTILLAAGSLALAFAVGVLLAICLSMLPDRLSSICSALAVGPILFPSLSAVIGWTMLFAPTVGYGNQLLRATPFFEGTTGPITVYSLPWIIAITGLYLVPYIFVIVSTSMRQLDPSMEAAARVSGSGWLRVQFEIILPAVRPAIVYGAIIGLLIGLGQFTVPLLLGAQAGTEVITSRLYRLTAESPTNLPLAAFLATPILLFSVMLVWWQGRRVGSLGRYASTTKGVGHQRRTRKIAAIPFVVYFVVAVVPPTIALVLVSLSRFWSGQIDWGGLTLDNFVGVWENARTRRSLVNTVQLAVAATAMTLVLSLLVSRFLILSRGRVRAILDTAVNLPLAVSPIIFALGIYLSYSVGAFDLYGSLALFIIAWTILTLPHGVRVLLATQAQIGTQYMAAARVSGSTQLGAHLRILLPLLRKALASVGMLIFVMVSHEFAAASLVGTVENQVLSTRLYEAWSSGGYPPVAAIALVMVLVSAVGGVVSLALGGRAAPTSRDG